MAIGVALMTFVGDAEFRFLAFIANPIYVSGLFLLYLGSARFFGRKPRIWLLLVIYLSFAVTYYFFMFVSNNLAARSFVLDLVVTIISALTVACFFSERRKRPKATIRFLAFIFLFYCAISLYRTILALLMPPDSVYASQKELLIFALIYPMVFSTLWTFGFIDLLGQAQAEKFQDSRAPSNIEGSRVLSDREKEIVSLLVQGLSYDQIAESCFISKNTIKTHVTHIYS
jgi:DNA-binding CsgD family transcriptional regulator